MRFVFNIFSEEKPLRMLAFPGLFLLCFSIYILHTLVHTCTDTCTDTCIHTVHTRLDSDEGQEKQPGLSAGFEGARLPAWCWARPPPSRVLPATDASVRTTAHTSCHLGVRSDCSGSEDAHGIAWHGCAGPVFLTFLKVRETLLALLLASGWVPWP